MLKRVRLKDIAKIAEVSESTVSLVLNDGPLRITESKKQEIKRIAKELNYTPNRIARSLSMQKTHTIGLIIPDIENPYFSSLTKRIEDILRIKGYLVFILNNNDSVENDVFMLQELVDRLVDGIVIIPARDSYTNQSLIRESLQNLLVPYVVVDRVFNSFSTNQVIFDNEFGGYLATKHLIQLGSKNPICITGSLDSYTGLQRFNGYTRALKEYHIEVIKANVYEGDFYFDTGYIIGEELVKRTDFDGVFASNDLMGYGIIKSMTDNDYDFTSVNIVGYDNLKQSEMFGIKLSSIEQNIDLLADHVCNQLLEQIKNPKFSIQTTLTPTLVKR